MTQDQEIEFERLKTARDALLLTVANLRGQLKTIAAEEREACAKVCETLWDTPDNGMSTEEECYGNQCATAIRARGQA